jgi:hypothetical protein
VGDWQWLIIGARELTPAELGELEKWEAEADEHRIGPGHT